MEFKGQRVKALKCLVSLGWGVCELSRWGEIDRKRDFRYKTKICSIFNLLYLSSKYYQEQFLRINQNFYFTVTGKLKICYAQTFSELYLTLLLHKKNNNNSKMQ